MRSTPTLPSMRFKREDLLDALKARRPWAETLDAKNLAEHQRAERAYLKAFRDSCRDALKWDYPTLKEHYGELRMRGNMGMPACPRSVVVRLERIITFVEKDHRQVCIVSTAGEWGEAHWLLNYDENAPKEALC